MVVVVVNCVTCVGPDANELMRMLNENYHCRGRLFVPLRRILGEKEYKSRLE